MSETLHQGQAVQEEAAEAAPKETLSQKVVAPVPKAGRRRWLMYVLLPVLLLSGGTVGYHWWQYSLVHESTDDAYVHGTAALISTRISGIVVEVLVDDNRPVRQGDLLVRLDPTDYQVAVEHAEAAVAMAQLRLESAKLSVPYSRDQTAALVKEARARLATLRQTLQSLQAGLRQKHMEVEAAAANREKAQKELARVQGLRQSGIVATADLDNTTAAYKVAAANREAALAAQRVEEEKVSATRQQMQEIEAQIALAETGSLSTRMRVFDSESLQADLQQAQANLKQARIRLSYTDIRAPLAGYVSKKNVDVGNYIEPGRALLAIVPLHDVWIDANFKEGQLEEIRLGQPALIEADAYPGYHYRGHVDSISAGTGDAFSLLPPENATGNWVKVTRRVPVKIVLDQPPLPEYPLRLGMSTTVTIDTHDHRGPRLRGYTLPRRAQETPSP
jgi:membrane fusion protein (multidrug efflux system)